MEVLWTVIPFLIVVGIGVYATPAVMAQKDTSNADLTIKVTGYQWKWGYIFERRRKVSSSCQLQLPMSRG